MRDRFLKILTWAWIAMVMAVSLQPHRPSSVVRSLVHRPFHFVAFGLVALLLWGSSANFRGAFLPPRLRPATGWIHALVLAILFGASIEILQHILYRGALEWQDIRDDALGAAVAILAGLLLRPMLPATSRP